MDNPMHAGPRPRRGPTHLAVELLVLLCLCTPAPGVISQADAAPSAGKTLRWSGAGELVNCDPHTVTDTGAVVMTSHIYERLISYDRDYRMQPSLAVSWERVSPTAMRFKLREGVRFHDGSPFTADDVVFSHERQARPTSLTRSSAAGITKVEKVDDHTVIFHTEQPHPTLLNSVALSPIMSHAWAKAHGALEPANFVDGKEGYASRHANGTGPYRLKSYESGGKVVFEAHPGWWGKREGNVQTATYIPIKSNATRIASLLSGEVDLLLDPPIQDLERLRRDPALKILPIPEARVLFIVMDLARKELLFSDVKGRNPFQDIRVRQAVRLAIDHDLIHRKVMRGNSKPIGSLIAEGINGYSARAAAVTPPDPARARKLLAEAGYPQGFGVTLDCTNDRYLLDEQLCGAVAGMLSRIGIRAEANAKPKSIFFQRTDANRRETSLFIWGLFPTTLDAHTVLDGTFRTKTALRGDNNSAGYSDPEMDKLLDDAQVELDPVRRNRLMEEVMLKNTREAIVIPIHQQRPAWAMRRNISTPARLDNGLDLRFVTVK